MARLFSAVEKSVKGSLRKGGRDGLAILLVYASPGPARTARGFAWPGEGWVVEQVPHRNLFEPKNSDLSTLPG